MKVFVIGVGLIGGSMALDLKRLDARFQIHGIDKNEDHLDTALELGVIDRKDSLDNIAQADRIILSIPVKQVVE